MNVYDFDGTIYAGDSSLQFWLFCLRRHPMLLRFLPRQLCGVLLYKLNRCSKTRMKEHYFSFVSGVADMEAEVAQFWKLYQKRMETWYTQQRHEQDVIISASPDFLLRPLCERMGIRRLIASRVCPKSGSFDGENCYGAEKVRRFRALFPDAAIEAFYSDSLSDAPMAAISEAAYMVRHGYIEYWHIKHLT